MPRRRFRQLRPIVLIGLVAVLLLIGSAVAFGAFSHTRSMRTTDAFMGASCVFRTSGMPLAGDADWHEMSMTLYAPNEYRNGVTFPVTWAVAFGRSDGYDSYPADQLSDGKLHAYTLATYARGDADHNHDFMYVGGRETPLEIQADRDYAVKVAYSGERRWLPYSSEPTRGASADWADKQGHWAYRWVATLDGAFVGDCWFNAPVGRIKFECNKVRSPRVKARNHFKNLAVKTTPEGGYRALAASASFPLHSAVGGYMTDVKPYSLATFTFGSAGIGMKTSSTRPLPREMVTLTGSVFDRATSAGVAGVPVSLFRSVDSGKTWTHVYRTTSSSKGNVAVSDRPLGPTRYRWSSVDTDLYYPGDSAIVYVLPSERVTLNATPASVTKGSYLTVRSTLLPSHAGAGPVVLTGEHWEKGRWVLRSSQTMLASSDGVTYRRTLTMSLPGSWRLRAYHTHAGKPIVYSDYRAITVK